MALGGGTFNTMNKVLPGSYINYIGNTSSVSIGDRGTVSLPLELDWGKEGGIIKMASSDFLADCKTVFGHIPTDPAVLLIKEAMKRATKVLVYRVNSGGAKATGTVGGLTVTAKYTGARGNSLAVSVAVNVENESLFDVVTYLDKTVVDAQTVSAVSQLTENSFVTFGGTGTLSAASAVTLTGGTNGTADGESYTDFLNAVEAEEFNAMCYTGSDETIKALFGAFTKRLRDEEGKKIVTVMADYAGDNIGLISVKNGVVLTDGTVLDKYKATVWVAAATAAAQVNESLTENAYEDAVDVDVRYKKSEYTEALQSGQFCFYYDPSEKKAKVLQDINTLTTFTATQPQDWNSNRLVRTMDGLALESASLFGKKYVGKVDNDAVGRNLLHGDLLALLLIYQGLHAVEDVKTEDIVVTKGSGKRDVVVTMAVQGVDSMEKLYMTIYMN